MAGTRVLVVDAEAPVGRELEAALRRLGYSVTSVENSGRKAVQKALEVKPALVLMDVALPIQRVSLEGICDTLVPASRIMRDHGALEALRSGWSGGIRLPPERVEVAGLDLSAACSTWRLKRALG